jgi:hypothetical protein
MTDIVRIPFSGGEVLTVDTNSKPHVILRPVFEAIGLDADQQIRKLQRQPWATTVVTTGVGEDGKTRQMIAADVRTFLMALATIPATRVSDEARPVLIAYQSEVADAIESYWTKGGSINPRATEDQLAAIISRAKGQADVLAALRGIVAPSWLEAKARHVAARALGEEPELDPMARPLTVGEFLEDKGLSAAERRSVGSKLGGRVKGLFIGEHGRMPEQVERFVDGALRSVFAYTEKDRPLFELAWAALSASTRAGR